MKKKALTIGNRFDQQDVLPLGKSSEDGRHCECDERGRIWWRGLGVCVLDRGLFGLRNGRRRASSLWQGGSLRDTDRVGSGCVAFPWRRCAIRFLADEAMRTDKDRARRAARVSRDKKGQRARHKPQKGGIGGREKGERKTQKKKEKINSKCRDGRRKDGKTTAKGGGVLPSSSRCGKKWEQKSVR